MMKERISYDVSRYIEIILSFLKKYADILNGYFKMLPVNVQEFIWLFLAFLLPLCFAEAVISLGVSVFVKRHDYLYDDEKHLTYDFFFGTRKHLKSSMKIEHFKRLRNNDWNKFSLSYWHNRLKLFPSEHLFLKFLIRLVCIPLSVIASLEKVFKWVFGFILYKVVSLFELIVYTCAKLIVLLYFPVVSVIYISQLQAQKCTECYREFKKPVYICPSCGMHHNDLKPGRYGMILSRCKCGKMINILPKKQGTKHFCCPHPDCFGRQ